MASIQTQNDPASTDDNASSRSAFSSRLGFVMAAAGSAVGVGNIWGFPTQVADHGGAAFLLVYLVMVVILAYPMLVAEMTIGRMAQKNPVAAMASLSDKPFWKRTGAIIGIAGIVTLSLIISFYAIISGWLLAFMLEPLAKLAGMNGLAHWLTSFSTSLNLFAMLAFMALTIHVVRAGVSNGIERWSKRLMPVMFVLLIGLVAYIMTLEGAEQGLIMYLKPDFSHFLEPSLLVNAMGQAFFSLSLGVCAIMVYGSYLSDKESLPKTAAMVAGLDTSVALLAGLLVIPAMTVAQANGVTIYAADGSLLEADTLVFTVLPALFNSMGAAGSVVSMAFFALMCIAALTSAISMLEAPVNTACEQLKSSRSQMSIVIGGAVSLVSAIIILNFESLFGLVVTLTTVYGQPMLAMLFGLMLTWVLRRDRLLKELKKGYPELEQSWFWKIWPWYVKFVCPVLMLFVLLK
ncbi:sodium-dependent transporter [Endozoicomonas montiporae]|uniref:SNF family Na(+)-dependent transporter n=1 Tax=Endozoicomonas montiporae CL-33 TaxID=570277 RepID=A0A142BGZ8_9GAMM|nr:sodium-dependent transporter [Endozoicomonas montiporae]AMO58024.1 SNF family Na(+)-dependent transporter [Endozoicomonas montiporae CL-33]